MSVEKSISTIGKLKYSKDSILVNFICNIHQYRMCTFYKNKTISNMSSVFIYTNIQYIWQKNQEKADTGFCSINLP